MVEAKVRLYRFLVEMGRLTEEEFRQITGEDYATNWFISCLIWNYYETGRDNKRAKQTNRKTG